VVLVAWSAAGCHVVGRESLGPSLFSVSDGEGLQWRYRRNQRYGGGAFTVQIAARDE
jgi:hypothetical protein